MDSDQEIITESASQTTSVGEQFGHSCLKHKGEGSPHSQRIFCLYGNLGTGKTTFAQGFAKGLGITSRLLSPTFIIVRRYSLSQTYRFMYHVDLYRVQTDSEMTELGLAEIFSDKHSVVLIEWSEKLGTFIPQIRTDIYFSLLENGNHSITIKK